MQITIFHYFKRLNLTFKESNKHETVNDDLITINTC